MAMPAYPSLKPAPTPQQKAARVANIWGWSYIITILAIFTAPDTPAGPLRQCVVDLSVFFTFIGILELYWRHKLIKTANGRWIKVLALNEVGATLVLLWNLWLIQSIPQSTLVEYMKSNISPETWKMLKQFGSATGNANAINDAVIGHAVDVSKAVIVKGVGPIVFLSQLWVIYRYLSFAREMERTPVASKNIPPVLK